MCIGESSISETPICALKLVIFNGDIESLVLRTEQDVEISLSTEQDVELTLNRK